VRCHPARSEKSKRRRRRRASDSAYRVSDVPAPSQLGSGCGSTCFPVRLSQVSRLPTILRASELEAVEVRHVPTLVIAICLFVKVAEQVKGFNTHIRSARAFT
jgi:hypothetical protein